MIGQMEFEGMHAAYDKAEKVSPGWGETAFQALKTAAQQMTKPFTIEQMRLALRMVGIQSPTDERAYGAVVMRAKRERVIEKTGDFAPAASSHGSPKPLWKRVEGNDV